MDNRTDVTEDQQATPEHAAPSQEKAGLAAGPHNDPPQSAGIEDTYRAPASAPVSQGELMWQSLQRTADRYPLRIALSVAGLGLAVILLARGRARSR